MDPIDIEDTQEVYTEVVEKKTRLWAGETPRDAREVEQKRTILRKENPMLPMKKIKKKVDTKGEAPSTSHEKVVDVEKMEEGKEEMFDGYHLIHHGVLQSRCSFMP